MNLLLIILSFIVIFQVLEPMVYIFIVATAFQTQFLKHSIILDIFLL